MLFQHSKVGEIIVWFAGTRDLPYRPTSYSFTRSIPTDFSHRDDANMKAFKPDVSESPETDVS